MQHDAGNLFPISALRLGVEKPQIGHEVRFIIQRDIRAIRRLVIHIGIKLGFHTHLALSFGKGFKQLIAVA